MVKMTVEEFAEKHLLPGWYIDVCGMYCLNLGRYLITVFQNDIGGVLEVCVDELSERGAYEGNREWETPETEKDVAETALRFAKQYAPKE